MTQPPIPPDSQPLSRYDRIMGWLLPAVAGITPLIVSPSFALAPPRQQGYFLMLATLALTAALGVAWIAGWRRLPGRPTLPAALALGLLASAVVSVGRTGQWSFGLRQALLPVCAGLFLFHLVQHPLRRLVLRRTTQLMIVLAGVLSIYGILQYFGFDFLHWSDQVEKNTVIATIGHPNFLGSVLGPLVFVVIGLALEWKGRRASLGAIALIALMMLCIGLARTRAVWLGMALGFLLLIGLVLWYSLRHRIGLRLVRRLVGGLALVVVLLAVVLGALLPAMNRGIGLSGRLLSTYEIKSRFYYWNCAIDLARTQPVFGIGVGMFDPSFWPYALAHQESPIGRYYYDYLPAIAGKTPQHVHDEYLETFVEQGAVGLVLLMALLSYFLVFGLGAALRCTDPRRALRLLCFVAALAMMLVDALFGFPWRLPVSLLVFVLVLAWLYDAIYPQLPPPAPAD